MITLTLSRDLLSPPQLPLTINDSGTGTYVLVSMEPGVRAKDNAYARSRWLDGAQLVSTRQDLLSLELVIRINANGMAALKAAAEALDDAFDQWSYTITEQVAGAVGSTIYTCCPANTAFGYDPVQFRANTGIYTASVPRQP